MNWESKVLSADQMLSSCLCLFFKINPWMFVLPAALISLLFATYFVLGLGFLSGFFYISLVLIFSAIFCSCTALNHYKAICVYETKGSIEESSDKREDIAEAKEEKEEKEDDEKEEKTSYYAEETSDQREDITETKEEDDEDINNFSTRSPDSVSNEESHQEIMSTSEESDELDDYWPLDRSIDGSDEGSISDEESLIEIALPTGHCSLKHQQEKHSLKVMSDLLAEYNFDMNEEDNLIEIDISMGSIKSYPSRFEIQA